MSVWKRTNKILANHLINIMAYCGKCGIQLEDDAKFCPKCGAPVDGIEDVGKKDVEDQEEIRIKRVIVAFAITIIFILGGIGYFNNKKTEEAAKAQEKKEELIRQENERIQREREREEEKRRKGVEKVVELSCRQNSYTYGDMSCSGNYGAIITNAYNVITDYIEIPQGKVWIYERHECIGPCAIMLLYYSRNNGALVYKKMKGRYGEVSCYDTKRYIVDDGRPTVLKPGDGFRIELSPHLSPGESAFMKIYFKEKYEEYAY